MRRRPAIVLLGALFLLALLTVVIAVPPANQDDPSSRSAGRLGTLALYTWLQRLGLPVSRVSGTFSLQGSDVLVEYDPTDDLSASDVGVVMDHLGSGGDVILAVSADSLPAAAPLLQRAGLVPAGATPPGTATPAQPFDVADRVHQVPVGAGVAFLDTPPLVPLLVERNDVVAGAVAVGAGRLYVLGTTQPLSNDGLRAGDSGALVLTLLERARGGHIAFDEYHHGETSQASGGAGAIFAGPVGLAALLVAITAIAFLALNGRRLGRPVAEDAAEVPTATTYIDAMGGLLARSRRRGALAARYAEELKRRVGARAGVDGRLDDASFVAALETTGDPRASGVGSLLARARSLAAAQPDEPALLRLAREVDAMERAWSAMPVPAQSPR